MNSNKEQTTHAFMLRIPQEMLADLRVMAKEEQRSTHGQIYHILLNAARARQFKGQKKKLLAAAKALVEDGKRKGWKMP
jgi:hypothetical protein